MTSLENMRRELRERFERLKTGNPPVIETVRRAERATVYEVDGRYTVHLYGPWAGPRIYTALKSVSFPALTRWKRIDERTSRAVFPHPTNIKVDIDRGIMGQKLSGLNPEDRIEYRRRCFVKGCHVCGMMKDLKEHIKAVAEGRTVLPLATNIKLLKDRLDDLIEETDYAVLGYPDGYPPCFMNGKRLDGFYKKMEDAKRKIDAGDLPGAESDLDAAEEVFKLAALGVVVTRDMAELEYLIKKKRLPWE